MKKNSWLVLVLTGTVSSGLIADEVEIQTGETLVVDGQITTTGFENTGSLLVTETGEITHKTALVNDGFINNFGSIDSTPNQITNNGNIANYGNLTTAMIDATITNNGVLENLGGLIQAEILENNGEMTNTGELEFVYLANTNVFTNQTNFEIGGEVFSNSQYGQFNNEALLTISSRLTGGTVNNYSTMTNNGEYWWGTLNNEGTFINNRSVGNGTEGLDFLNNTGDVVNNEYMFIGEDITNTGTIENNGYLQNFNGTLSNDGGIVNSGTLIAGNIVNAGHSEIQSTGQLVGTLLENRSSMTTTGDTYIWDSQNHSGIQTNAGRYEAEYFMNSATFTNTGEMIVSNEFENTHALTITETGSLNTRNSITGGGSLINDGIVTTSSPSLMINSDVTGSGSFAADSLGFEGSLSAGTGIGEMTLNGDVTFAESLSLVVDIDGTDRGVTYDAIDILGSLHIDQTELILSFVHGHQDSAVDASFDILYATGLITGNFLASTAGWQYFIESGDYSNGFTNRIRATYVPAPISLFIFAIGLLAMVFGTNRRW